MRNPHPNAAIAANVNSADNGNAAAISACAIVMAWIWGVNGVWLSFLAAEVITLGVSMCFLK